MDEKTLQEKYYTFQMIDQQIKAINEQLQDLNNKLLEVEYIKMSLDELRNVKKGTEILAPITNGIFVKARVENTAELLVNVGKGTVVVKDVDATKKLMNEQLCEIDKVRAELMDQLTQYSNQAELLEKELISLTE